MGRKRKQIGKKYGFGKGYTPWNFGKKMDFEKNSSIQKCSRLTENVYNSRVHKNLNGTLTIHDVDGSIVNQKILRPKPGCPDIVDTYLQTEAPRPNAEINKVYTPIYLEALFNSVWRNHKTFNPECNGDLKFDDENHKQWGLAWRERFKCSDCDFVSQYYKTYKEVDTGKCGQKAAAINLQAQTALMHTSISNKAFREMLMTSNIIPPSPSGMQKSANKVSKMVEEINRESMKSIRENLVTENRLCGLSDETLVRVESDSRYNNPIINSGTTPFQAGTQVVTTMSENNTFDKKIISLNTANKLCNVAARMRGKGIEVKCPNHEGICTANLAEDATVGNEAAYSAECAREVSDCLKISHVTTDGDSKSFQGIKNVHGQEVQALRCVRHLSVSMKRAIVRCTFSTSMFRGVNKNNQKTRFALDIKARCMAELNQSFKMHNGELYKIKSHMPEVIKAIIMCYKGYCGYTCRVNSYVCAGLPSNHWKRYYIANDTNCRMTCEDEVKVENCMQLLLGTKSLDLVRFLTSTQKSEAFNRSLSRCNPKNVTFSRNFPGRAHAAVHMRNHRFANSILIILEKLGAPITPGSSVAKQLKQTDIIEIYMKAYKRLPSSKLKRAKSRNRKYQLHAFIHYPKPLFYKKGIADPKYDKKCVKKPINMREHNYPKRS